VAARSPTRSERLLEAFTSHRPCSVRAGTDGRNRRKRQADREADATPLEGRRQSVWSGGIIQCSLWELTSEHHRSLVPSHALRFRET
jgi:hypothetical protein